MENTIALNTGAHMPLLGLGTYKMTDAQDTPRVIRDAFSMGYRLIDTASSYKNEDLVGQAMKDCSLKREDLFVTTKVWNTAQRIGNVEGAFERSLDRLGLDYVDLYMIHWPVAGCYIDTWHVLEDLYRSGRARAIGVCNFNEIQLTDLLEHSSVVPAVNQIEFHPLNNEDSLRLFCQKNGIVVQAYSPLARGAYLNREVLKKIAERHYRSVPQVGLRWLVQKGCSVIPKAAQLDRLLENTQIFDFTLDETEMATIDSLNENYHSANVPEDMQQSGM
ncbi:MAG: aldo/keto reductase [Lachnospiraceae bacterium]|nr:aldo/keto reductase [Lachnospiraceae bacterium]